MENESFKKLTREQLTRISGGGSCLVTCPGGTGTISCNGPSVNCRSDGNYDCSSYNGAELLQYKTCGRDEEMPY